LSSFRSSVGKALWLYSPVRPSAGSRSNPSDSIHHQVLTGVFILASTTARTSNELLGWNCAYSYVSNVMYGVLYAISPELFPTKDRGTGNAIVATANRIFGVMVSPSCYYAHILTLLTPPRLRSLLCTQTLRRLYRFGLRGLFSLSLVLSLSCYHLNLVVTRLCST
jgi:MFS family permease